MNTIDFDKLDFGEVDAENDILLKDVFIDLNIYHKALDGKTSYVIGRKGSGKSAIYEYIKRSKRDSAGAFINALTFDDYPWRMHETLIDESVPAQDRYKHTWKYIILMTLAKNIVEKKCWFKKFIFGGNDLRSISSYLKSTYSSYSPGLGEYFFDKARRLKPALMILGTGGSLEIGEEKIPERIVSENINLFNSEYIGKILNLLEDSKEYFVLLDRLDTGWDPRENRDEILTGLMIAAREINIEARNVGKNVKVIVFLRDDIYDTLKFEDKSKHEDYVERITWDKETLKALIEKRIRISTGNLNATLESILTMDKIHKNELQPNYIFKRTMMRPRDIIVFCKECLKAFRGFNRKGIKKEKFDNTVIKEAENGHSARFRSELIDENFKSNPELENVFKALSELGLTKFSLAEVSPYLEKHTDLKPKEAIQLLFDLGILGILIRGGDPLAQGVTYRYMHREFELDFEKELYIHPALKLCLSLKEPRKKR